MRPKILTFGAGSKVTHPAKIFSGIFLKNFSGRLGIFFSRLDSPHFRAVPLRDRFLTLPFFQDLAAGWVRKNWIFWDKLGITPRRRGRNDSAIFFLNAPQKVVSQGYLDYPDLLGLSWDIWKNNERQIHFIYIGGGTKGFFQKCFFRGFYAWFGFSAKK